MIVLDTNVISELRKDEPSAPIAAWADSMAMGDLWITTGTDCAGAAGNSRPYRDPEKTFHASPCTLPSDEPIFVDKPSDQRVSSWFSFANILDGCVELECWLPSCCCEKACVMVKKRRPDPNTPVERTRRTIEETTHRSETIEEFDTETGRITRRLIRSEDKDTRITEDVQSDAGVNLAESAPLRRLPDDPVTLQAIQYTSRTANGVTVYPVSQRTVYRNEDASGAISTRYAFTWYSGTVQQKERTTTLPVVSTSQNGSGVAAIRKEYFDEHGYATWSMNERGFITRRTVDVPTGAITKNIEDVDTSLYGDVPSGWVTPSGGGLNRITDYVNDDLGRPTQTLRPVHTIDLSGTATSIRSADWTVYADDQFTIRRGRGYQVVADGSFTLINPVNITVTDAGGRPEQQIRATRGSDVTSPGKLLPTDTFSQSSYTAWSTTQYIDCCIVASQRVYHTIPASGAGSAGTHYEQTSFGYDVMKRRNRTITPGGTITFNVLDSRGLPVESWTGTDDTGATSSDPSGGGAAGNNMVQTTGRQYDDGNDGGNGTPTRQTQFVDGSTTRVTRVQFDWRDRRTSIEED